MEIDFKTGKVIYTNNLNEDSEQIRQSFEEMKIKDNVEEPVFSKTIHKNLKYGRLKYLLYCFLLMMDGLIGIVSFGQTQSILAQKYLLSKWILCEGEEHGDR